jgi:hypothetical protein
MAVMHVPSRPARQRYEIRTNAAAATAKGSGGGGRRRASTTVRSGEKRFLSRTSLKFLAAGQAGSATKMRRRFTTIPAARWPSISAW